MKKIGIIGAGISGLYLANILNNNPYFDYRIIEKKDYINLSEGYGIQLSVNSVKLLNEIGFKSLPASDVYFPSKVNFFDNKNFNKICDIDLSQFNNKLIRYTTLKRSVLLNFLIKKIPQDKIKFNTTLTHLEKGNIIKTKFSDKSEENFDFLILADGVFSSTRSLVLNKSFKPKYNNSIALRAEIKNYDIRNISIHMAPHFHCVIYPIDQNGNCNFVSIVDKKLTKKELNDHKLLNSENFINIIREKIENKSIIKFENLYNIKTFPIFVSNKFTNINQKNIFLSGDALFSFPPSIAQGASQSIETAEDIFDCINNESSNLYKKRISKISSINYKSKINHFAFHLSNPLSILLRNIILKYLSKNKNFLENYLGKIYRN